MTSIYLAGKISKNDWRHDTVVGQDGRWLRGLWSDDNAGKPPFEEWPVWHRAVLGTFDYTGPYFISDDHGCAHGRDTHGCGTGDLICAADPGPTQERTRDLCFAAIRRSDIFFAWLDDPSAFGTLVELGYATALGKRIVTAVPINRAEGVQDMWFARTCGLQLYASSPREALKNLVSIVG